jgi:hypothetical protein
MVGMLEGRENGRGGKGNREPAEGWAGKERSNVADAELGLSGILERPVGERCNV